MPNVFDEEDIDEDSQRDDMNESETFDDTMLSDKNIEENEPQSSFSIYLFLKQKSPKKNSHPLIQKKFKKLSRMMLW